ncbi:MAG: PEGA domain-containing protein [Spirochaetales bacterium]|nr:PEGA domain-containing protein [Spirochaetales bacterium]
MKIKKRVILAILTITILLPISGLDLFIISDPMGARIILDKTPLEEKTPCLLREIEAGPHKIQLHMEGKVTEIFELEPGEGEETVIIRKSLVGPFFSAAFRNEEKLSINGSPIDAADKVVNLPVGLYNIDRDAGLSIEESFPGNSALRGVTMAFLTSLLYAGGLTLENILDDSEEFEITPLMATSWGVTALLGLGDLKLLADRGKFKRSREEANLSPDIPSPASLYSEAERFMSRGNLDTAFSWYSKIITGHPESIYMPQALYKLSKINIVNGNISLARAGLEELHTSYPLPELYDKVCHTLAGLYARENQLEKSEKYLDAMLFLDPLFTRDEIQEYRRDITSRAFNEPLASGISPQTMDPFTTNEETTEESANQEGAE